MHHPSNHPSPQLNSPTVIQLLTQLVHQQSQNNQLLRLIAYSNHSKLSIHSPPSKSQYKTTINHQSSIKTKSYKQIYLSTHPKISTNQPNTTQSPIQIATNNNHRQRNTPHSNTPHSNTPHSNQPINKIKKLKNQSKIQNLQHNPSSSPIKIIQQPKQDYKQIPNHQQITIRNNQHFQTQVLNQLETITNILDNKLNYQSQKQQLNLNVIKNYIQSKSQSVVQPFNNTQYYLSDHHRILDKKQIKVKINFIQIIANKQKKDFSKIQDINNEIYQWVSKTYTSTACLCWNLLQSNSLDCQQIQVLFTKNIIYNYISLMTEIKQLSKTNKIVNKNLQIQITDKINVFSKQILKFLCKKYPSNKKHDHEIVLKQPIPDINDYGYVKYDLIAKSKIKFQYNAQKNYAGKIMQFINYLIDIYDKQYQKTQNVLYEFIESINFQVRKQQNQSKNHQHFNNKQKLFNYYTARKITKNTQKYTRKQIQNGVFFMKSPHIISIISQWVQNLMNIIQDPIKMIRDWFYPFKTHNGEQINLSYYIKNQIYNIIITQNNKLKNKLKQIQKYLLEIQAQLTQQSHIKTNKLLPLAQQEINIGLFISNLNNALSQFLYRQLVQIIHFLLQIPMLLDIKKLNLNNIKQQSYVREQLNSLNLITFKIFNILKLTFTSGQSQVIQLINLFKDKYFKSKNKSTNKEINLVRIQDNLKIPLKSYVINTQIQNGVVFQIQFSVENKIDKTELNKNKYNKFLEKLNTKLYLGPFINNIQTWALLEQKSLFFNQITNQKYFSQNKNQKKNQCKTQELKIYCYPIICYYCDRFYHTAKTCLLNWKCMHCNKKICGECLYLGYEDIERKKHIFSSIFQDNFLNMLVQYQYVNNLDNFPQYSLFIPKKSVKKQLYFLKCYESSIRYPSKQIAQFNIKNSINKIIAKGFINQSQIQLEDIFIFKVDSKFIKIMQLQQVKKIIEKKNQSQTNINIFSTLFEPNYLLQLSKLKSITRLKAMIKSLQKIMKANGFDKFIVINFKQTVILAQIYIDNQQIRNKLKRRQNIQRLQKISKNNLTTICLENYGITTEFDQKKVQKRQIRYVYQNLFKNEKYKIFNIQDLWLIQEYFLLVKKFNIKDYNCLNSLKGVQGMKQLKNIQFSNNLIKSLQPLQGLYQLQIIIANNNKLQKLKGVQNLVNLNHLAVYNNKIQSLDNILNNLRKLKYLQTGKNQIKSFCQIFILNSLQSLSLEDNPLKIIGNLKSTPKLNNLSVNNIGLTQIPFRQFTNISLINLFLNDNHIQKIQGLKNQKNLKCLGFNNNTISVIEGLEDLKLQKLYLDNNKIKTISGIVNFLDTLKELRIKKNYIQDIGDLRFINSKLRVQWSFEYFLPKAAQQIQQLLDQNPTIITEDAVKSIINQDKYFLTK